MDNLNYDQPEEQECPKWQRRLVIIIEAAQLVLFVASLATFVYGIYLALQ